MTKEARAWGRKYLIAVSVVLKLSLRRIKGIRLIRLISRPSQHVIHEFDEHAITVPVISRMLNMVE